MLDSLIENQSSGIIESSAAIEEMLGNITSVNATVGKMADEYKELMEITEFEKDRQLTVAEQIKEMSSQSQHLSETVAGSMDEMTHGVQEINSSAQNVSEMASKTKENIGVVKSNIDKFIL